MAIDWAATGAMLSGLGSFASAAAVAFAAHKAANTFDDWKRRRAAERAEEIAQEAILATYATVKVLGLVRDSHLSANEAAIVVDPKILSVTDCPSEPLAHSRWVTAETLMLRMGRIQNELDRLISVYPMANAMFGEKVGEAILKVHRVPTGIASILLSYIQTDEDSELGQELKEELFDPQLRNESTISTTLRDCQQLIETELSPHLRGPERRG